MRSLGESQEQGKSNNLQEKSSHLFQASANSREDEVSENAIEKDKESENCK